MHTPAGYRIVAGVFEPTDWWAVIFNPSFPYRRAHMVLAAFITTCFVIGGISAVYLLRNRHVESATLMLKLSIGFAAITVPLQILAGDLEPLRSTGGVAPRGGPLLEEVEDRLAGRHAMDQAFR
jgi:cytochrome d ubiquinol oxidase subunit I